MPFLQAARECWLQSHARPEDAGLSTSDHEKPSIWDTTFMITYSRQRESDSGACMPERRCDGERMAPGGPGFEEPIAGASRQVSWCDW
jgi:hypothetical protein